VGITERVLAQHFEPVMLEVGPQNLGQQRQIVLLAARRSRRAPGNSGELTARAKNLAEPALDAAGCVHFIKSLSKGSTY
jgi:hypothetical protein